MIEKKRPTVGKLASDLLVKANQNPVSAIDQMQESLTEYDKNIWETVSRGIADFSADFYVVVITKKERLMQNVIRNYFFCRITCPTPDYDQTVYKYNRADDNIEFIWVIPSKDACHYLIDNALQVDPSERELLQFVFSFADGSLYKRAKQLNGEAEDSIQLIN
jgi:hypothetical protein